MLILVKLQNNNTYYQKTHQIKLIKLKYKLYKQVIILIIHMSHLKIVLMMIELFKIFNLNLDYNDSILRKE